MDSNDAFVIATALGCFSMLVILGIAVIAATLDG